MYQGQSLFVFVLRLGTDRQFEICTALLINGVFVKSFHTKQDQRLTSKASGTEFKSYICSTVVVLKEREINFPESTEWCKKKFATVKPLWQFVLLCVMWWSVWVKRWSWMLLNVFNCSTFYCVLYIVPTDCVKQGISYSVIVNICAKYS